MTQSYREKLIFVNGMLEGIAWVVQDNNLGEALNSIQDQIETVLKEEADESY